MVLILAACHYLMSHVDEFDVVYPTSSRLPASIQQLRPDGITVQSNGVWLEFHSGAYSFGLRAFPEGEKAPAPDRHWKRVIDSLWFYDSDILELAAHEY